MIPAKTLLKGDTGKRGRTGKRGPRGESVRGPQGPPGPPGVISNHFTLYKFRYYNHFDWGLSQATDLSLLCDSLSVYVTDKQTCFHFESKIPIRSIIIHYECSDKIRTYIGDYQNTVTFEYVPRSGDRGDICITW